MKFLTLEIGHFGSIESIALNLDDQGLVLITGQNDDAPKADSNGAGKSLLLEAICWCFWGKTIRGLKNDEVVKEIAGKPGKNCRVKVTFVEDDVTYVVERWRRHEIIEGIDKPNDLRLYRNGDPNATGANMAETQKRIDNILGLNFDTFCVMMPGAGVRASEMTDAQVKDLLERLLRTELLGIAQKHTKGRLKEVQERLMVAEAVLQQLNGFCAQAEQRLEHAQKDLDNYEDNKNIRIAQFQKQLDTLYEEMAGLEKTIGLGEGLADKLENVNQLYVETLSEVESLQERYDKDYHEFQKQTLIYRTYVDRDMLLKKQEYKKLDRFNDLGAAQEGVVECPKCFQLVTAGHAEKIVAEIAATIQELDERIADHIKEENAFVESTTKALNTLKGELHEANHRKGLHQSSMDVLVEVSKKVSAAKELKARLEKQEASLKALQDHTRAEVNPFEGVQERIVQEAAEKAQEAALRTQEIESLKNQQAVYDYWLTGFSPGGIRSFMLEHVTPILNESAAHYSNLLTDGEMSVTFNTQKKLKNGKTVEKFNIVVDQTHGGSSYTASSTGERSRANLVIAFALGDLASMRANKSISFRFLDEPFESVDESGVDAILNLLNEHKKRFDSVFVITHQDHFKSLFTNRLNVVKKGGTTRLIA